MPLEKKPKTGRYVKGILLVDYIKMIRANPDLPWSEHLSAEDLEQANQLILPGSWYPIEFFQRIGMAVFKVVAKGNYQLIHAYGRSLAEKMNAENPGMVSKGRPRDTLRKYRAIQDRLYSFKPVETEDLGPGHLVVKTFSKPDGPEAQVIMEIVAGTIERLIELAGGSNVKTKLLEAVWEGEDQNALEVKWDE